MWKMLKTNADMRRVFMAQVISYLGDWFSFVAIIGLVDDLTGSKFLVSLVVVAFSLPSFLASPIAGSMADRFDRRRILVFVSVIQVVAAFGLLFVVKDTVCWHSWLKAQFLPLPPSSAQPLKPQSQTLLETTTN